MEKHRYYLTKEGMTKLQGELENLIGIQRPNVLQELETARAQGDLSENADYDAARSHQAEIEGRIKQVENAIANAVIVDEATSSEFVALGTTIVFRDLSLNEEFEYHLVGTIEADPLSGSISIQSPLGEAMLGARVGDVRKVKAIEPYEIEIIKITI
ncbi:MAG TPA: transcription elongation factor GreA [Bacilli bacterium]|jgi:transcription elongation factor GreA|nr:transcription elongation factor GreA [Bacilli bacterium]MDD3388898.1 transcription elongation factor GreA [Bacilli bacterium]MDD4344648.1 transcription elongation factor GreA [Bacilli bacterium]HKM10935.1 transcription elongation factor GreA [Bacilli bacterium]